MFSTLTSENTGIAAAANWPASFRNGDRPSAEDPARLAVPRQKQGTGQQHAGEDRQPTQARRGALVEAALPGKVDRSDAVGELLGKGCEHQCHRARDQERPERLEVVHPFAL
jgi:hypothetical protein